MVVTPLLVVLRSYNYIDKCHYNYADTHDIQMASISETPDNEVEISISFSSVSLARGALLLIHGGVGAETSISFLPLGQNMTMNYTLPFSLPTGLWNIFSYEIEQDGTLRSGVSYPAATSKLTISEMSTSMLVYIMHV